MGGQLPSAECPQSSLHWTLPITLSNSLRYFVELLTILCRDTVAVTIHPQLGVSQVFF